MSIVTLNNISLNLPNATRPILKNINYAIEKNDFIILLGSNGSGKSSLLKLIYRDYKSNQGQLYLMDKLIDNYSSYEFSCRVAVLTQNSADSLFTSLTVYENYLLVQHQKDDREFFKHYLIDFNPNLAKKLDNTIDQLSGGERQALVLALCLLKKPDLLLLDEHTSALDPKTSQSIMALTHKMIEKHHITCMLTTHDLDIALHYGNRILVLREGEIYKTFDAPDKSQLTKDMLAEGCYT